MTTYKIELLLEALCATFSLEQLENSEIVRLSLADELDYQKEQIDALFNGAIRMKRLRQNRSEGTRGILYQ